MNLSSIIVYNQQIQLNARKFNIQAGEDIFPIMSKSQWKEHLTNLLNGARNLSEIIDLSILQIPQLDSELIEIIKEFNPDFITVDNNILHIEYGKEDDKYYCRTNVDENFARNTILDNIVLPGGRIVEIYCNNISANNFINLVEKIEGERIKRRLSQISTKYEKWTSKLDNVLEWIPEIGSKVEITRKDNGKGEPINGFITLKMEHNGWTKFITEDDRYKVIVDTQSIIEQIMKLFVDEIFTINREDPWYKNEGSFFSNWRLTELGQRLLDKFNELANVDYIENLSINNIIDRINNIKGLISSTKNEIEFGGKDKAIKNLNNSIELLRDSFNASKCYKK